MRDSNSIPGLRRTLKKGLTAHSSILAWRIPWTEEPGGLWSGLAKSRTRLRRLNMLQDSQIERLHSGFNRAFFFFFFFNFIFKFYIIVLVLPNITMNPPQVYMCSPSWTLLRPPSPYHSSGSSQCTSPRRMALKHVKYHVWNELPVQVRCTILVSNTFQVSYNILLLLIYLDNLKI